MDKIKLELTQEQIKIVLSGIAKLPLEMSVMTWNEVQAQLQAQKGKDESKPTGI